MVNQPRVRKVNSKKFNQNTLTLIYIIFFLTSLPNPFSLFFCRSQRMDQDWGVKWTPGSHRKCHGPFAFLTSYKNNSPEFCFVGDIFPWNYEQVSKGIHRVFIIFQFIKSIVSDCHSKGVPSYRQSILELLMSFFLH